MGNQNFENKMNEVLSLDEQRIVELLSGLDRVSTPNDFNFRVKARIASGAGATQRSWMPAALKLAFPVLLLMVISGFFLMRDPGPIVSEQLAKAEEVQLVPSAVSQEPATSAPQLTAPVEAAPAVKAEPRQMVASAKPSPRNSGATKATVSKGEPETPASSGSYDVSSNVTRGITLPSNGNVNRSFSTPKTSARPARLTAAGVFSLMGIKGSFTGSAFTVQGVNGNSAAEQSGIKTGDVIEAVNGQPVSGGITFPHDFTGGSLRVRRNGQSIVVNVGQ